MEKTKTVEESGEEITISILLYKIIKSLVKQWNLNVEQEEQLHKIAAQEINKQFQNG